MASCDRCLVKIPPDSGADMSIQSKKFERQIERIHKLIEQPGSIITWDDHLPDPDNPKQLRQIDITIKKDSKLTLVECRIHRRKQDVKWIEELIGRRTSLSADVVVAVSASGFTGGAVIKAKKHKIILRDLLQLTDEEVCEWGKYTPARITFYQYRNIELSFIFDLDMEVDVSQIDIDYYAEPIIRAFNRVKMEIDKLNFQNRSYVPIKCEIKPDNERLKNIEVKEIVFKAEVRLLEQALDIPSVLAYDIPQKPAKDRTVKIEKFDLVDFEVTHFSNNISVWIDFASIEYPTNSQFQYVYFNIKEPHNLRSFAPLGQIDMPIRMNNINLTTGYKAD